MSLYNQTRIHIKSEGTGHSTVVETEGGERIENIQKIELTITPDSFVEARIEVLIPKFDIVASVAEGRIPDLERASTVVADYLATLRDPKDIQYMLNVLNPVLIAAINAQDRLNDKPPATHSE